MKKTGTEVNMIVDITTAQDAHDVYCKFAFAKFNKYLTSTERQIITDKLIEKYFNELESYCNDHDCESCEIDRVDGTISLIKKKPNIFKRIWNKLFKRSSK